MSRLPIVADDLDNWGTILNDFLLVALNANGTLKDDIVTAAKIAGADKVAIRALLDIGSDTEVTAEIAAAVNAAVDDLSGVTDAATARSNLSVYSTTEVTNAIAAAVADYLLKSGGTLTGFLTLHADPTSALHAVTKQYTDGQSVTNGNAHNHNGGDGAQIESGGATALFGAWDAKVDNTIYQAATDGMVTAYNPPAQTGGQIDGITDSNAAPTTIRTTMYATTTNGWGISFPVKKGDYWKVTIAGFANVYWLPLGS